MLDDERVQCRVVRVALLSAAVVAAIFSTVLVGDGEVTDSGLGDQDEEHVLCGFALGSPRQLCAASSPHPSVSGVSIASPCLSVTTTTKKPQCNAMGFFCVLTNLVCVFSKRTDTVCGHGFQMIDAGRKLLEIRRLLHILWLDNVRSVVPLQKHGGRMLTCTPRHVHLERAPMMSTQCVSESRDHPVVQYLTVSHSLQEHSNAFAHGVVVLGGQIVSLCSQSGPPSCLPLNFCTAARRRLVRRAWARPAMLSSTIARVIEVEVDDRRTRG